MPKLAEPIRLSPALEGNMKDLVVGQGKWAGKAGGKAQGQHPRAGLSRGAWPSMRVNLGQEVVIGG